jgi:hypothetical protein
MRHTHPRPHTRPQQKGGGPVFALDDEGDIGVGFIIYKSTQIFAQALQAVLVLIYSSLGCIDAKRMYTHTLSG